MGPKGDSVQSMSKMNFWNGVMLSGRGSDSQAKVPLFELSFRARAVIAISTSSILGCRVTCLAKGKES